MNYHGRKIARAALARLPPAACRLSPVALRRRFGRRYGVARPLGCLPGAVTEQSQLVRRQLLPSLRDRRDPTFFVLGLEREPALTKCGWKGGRIYCGCGWIYGKHAPT